MSKYHLLKKLTIMATFAATLISNAQTPVDEVDVYIGGISHLLVPTFPTVHLPNSMMRFYPERYGLSCERINSFPLVRLGHRRAGSFYISPYSGECADSEIAYRFDNESVSPYSYEVFLDDQNATLKFAPAAQSGIFKIDFENAEQNGLALATMNGQLKLDGNVVSGVENCIPHKKRGVEIKVYLYAEVLGKIESARLENDGEKSQVFFNFANSEKSAEVAYAISLISIEQAKANFEKQMRGKTIAEVSENAKKIWNDTLSKIKIEGGTPAQRRVFYTSLYRAYERMINITEDGKYFSAFNGKVNDANGKDYYTDDWAWDTFRNLHPLQAILNPSEQGDKITSLVRAGEQSGAMPTFPQVNGDMHCMNGNHYVSIIWDAYSKGLRNFDLKAAYEICKKTLLERTMLPWVRAPKTDLDDFHKANGFFPAIAEEDDETNPSVHEFERRQAVSVNLAQSYDDWCMAQIVRELGLKDDVEFFEKRSFNYRNNWNPETNFFHPKDKDGEFIEAFDPSLSGGLGARAYFAENNAWSYNFDVMHNIEDLMELFESPADFETRLDQLFIEELGLPRYQFAGLQPDATGLMGQFSMGNEPTLHVPYLYNYLGKPWKSQKLIRTLLELWFRDDYMGVPGDEDGGTMSAFYVFSTLGFYPVTPGLPMYVIGSPHFERAQIQLPNGKTFEIVCNNYSLKNKYIQSAKLNGKELNRSWFTHEELANGGKLEFEMGLRANKNWASSPDSIPPSYKMK